MALNGTLVRSTVVAALGGLLFGFDTAVIAGATSQLTRAFDLTPRGLGFTVSIALWGTVLGALLASIPGDRFGRRDSLRVLGVSAVPAAFFFLMLFRIPRSPRWLAMKGRSAEARGVLEQIGEENIDAELEAMASALRLEQQQGKERLFSARTRFPVFLAVSIALFNQFSGINAILYYLNDIFARAGFSKVSSDLQAVAIGATNLVFTMLAMFDH
jgi:MFS family permease